MDLDLWDCCGRENKMDLEFETVLEEKEKWILIFEIVLE